MVANILNLDTMNLFVGDDDPSNSQFLRIINITLPNLEEAVKTYNPGGGAVAMEMGMRRMNSLMMSFSLSGIQLDVLPKFMTGRRIMYTARGNLANISDQTDTPVVATVEGRMTKATMSQFTKDNGVDTDYEVHEIMRYRLVVGTQEVFFLDAFAGPAGIRINGVQTFRDVARNIGLI